MSLHLYGLFLALEERVAAMRNERGASAVEYGLLVALIAIVIIGAVTLLGGNLKNVFNDIASVIVPKR